MKSALVKLVCGAKETTFKRADRLRFDSAGVQGTAFTESSSHLPKKCADGNMFKKKKAKAKHKASCKCSSCRGPSGKGKDSKVRKLKRLAGSGKRKKKKR